MRNRIADPARQRDELARGAESDPHHREGMARLGRLASEGGNATETVRLLTAAVVGDAPASAWFELGLAR
jgi:hypothetical protein